MIIGITGTLGAGKGTVVEILQKKGFIHFSVRGFLKTEIEKRGLPFDRDSMTLVANELRKNNSPSFIAEQLYELAKKSGKNAVIESLRTPGEIQALRKKGNFYLIAVDADTKTRYARIVKRGSESDNISYERFLEDEKREMSSNDPNKQNISACVAMADFKIENNGTVEDLNKQVDEIYREITGK